MERQLRNFYYVGRVSNEINRVNVAHSYATLSYDFGTVNKLTGQLSSSYGIAKRDALTMAFPNNFIPPINQGDFLGGPVWDIPFLNIAADFSYKLNQENILIFGGVFEFTEDSDTHNKGNYNFRTLKYLSKRKSTIG